MALWVALLLSLAGAGVLAAPVISWAIYSARRSREQLGSSQQAIREMREEMADLQRQVERQAAQTAVDQDHALVITSLGANDPVRGRAPRSLVVLRPTVSDRVAARAEGALARFLTRPSGGPGILRRAVDQGAVRVVALGFGVVRALRPEARDRIEFAARAGMRRSRRQREQELRLARRLVRSGHVVVSEER